MHGKANGLKFTLELEIYIHFYFILFHSFNPHVSIGVKRLSFLLNPHVYLGMCFDIGCPSCHMFQCLTSNLVMTLGFNQ